MATSNFSFDHRCIAMNNEQAEYFSDLFTLDPINGYGSRNFYEVSDFEFDFWRIVFAPGYYEGACLDYEEKPEDHLYNYCYRNYDSRAELFADVMDCFKVSRSTLYKVCRGVADPYECFDLVHDYLAERERRDVNEALDRLRDAEGFQELEIAHRFSNGETGYRIKKAN